MIREFIDRQKKAATFRARYPFAFASVERFIVWAGELNAAGEGPDVADGLAYHPIITPGVIGALRQEETNIRRGTK